MNNSYISHRCSRAFTLIEVTLAIALVAIGLSVAALAYIGYNSWGKDTAAHSNAVNLVTAVAQANSHGLLVTGNGHTFPVTVNVARANEIYAQISGPITAVGGQAAIVQIIATGYQLPTNASLPTGWSETAPGVFGPIP